MFSILNKKKTYVFITLSIISIAAALIIGIDDNPPGIILCFIGGLFLILAFTYNWNKVKPYLILAIASLLGFIISVLLHNFLSVTGEGTFLEIIGAFFFLTVIFLCPAGAFIGIVGSLIQAYKKMKKSNTLNDQLGERT
jgi:hypothetical protein